MDSGRGKIRMNVGGDRLSNLPDDLIHKILAYIDVKHAIETSALSSRWRYIWTSMPCLNFSSEDFRTLPEFSKFVTRVLTSRNNQIEVSSIKLTFHAKIGRVSLKRILEYAFSHNIQQLNITCLPGKKRLNIIKIPISLFSSPSLKHLTLTTLNLTSIHWEMPALTTLNLHNVELYEYITDSDKFARLLSNCANLKNLTLNNCRISGDTILHDGLSNLTLVGWYSGKVITPQLKHLTIRNCSNMHPIFAPELVSLHYKDYSHPLQFSANLVHLEKVDICIDYPLESKAYTREIVCLLQQFHSVKFLTLNLEIIKLLSSSVELISHQPSPFVNLKSLKIYPVDVTLEDQTQPKVTMSAEVRNYLLDSSPSATFTMVSHEEIRTARNVASSRILMRDLQVVLDQWKEKENKETNTAHMKQDKARIESQMATAHAQGEVENHSAEPDTKMKWHFRERMAYINSYWKDLNNQLEKGYKNTRFIISMLQHIEGVLRKLPTSHRDKLQAWFSSLSAEADTIMDNMLDSMKVQCDNKPSRSNVFFHEPATSSHSSS